MNSEKTAIPEAGERKAKSADGRNVGQARAAASHRRRRWSFRWPQTAHIFRSSFEVVRVLVTSASRLIPVAAAYWWPTISGQKLGCHVAINGSWLLRSIERERERDGHRLEIRAVLASVFFLLQRFTIVSPSSFSVVRFARGPNKKNESLPPVLSTQRDLSSMAFVFQRLASAFFSAFCRSRTSAPWRPSPKSWLSSRECYRRTELGSRGASVAFADGSMVSAALDYSSRQ